MALDFPSSPTNGQIFGSYIWSASKGVWQSREESAAVAITSPSKPLTANNGDIWYNTERGITYIYYDDGSSAQWVEVVTSGTPELSTKANLAGGNTFSGTQVFSTPIAVSSGGTGTNTLAASGYLKGNGASAITSQTGIPASDITSGTIDYSRFPSGTIVQVQSTTVTAAAAYSIAAFSLQDVGVNVTITPKSASNKIFIIANVSSAGVSFTRPGIVLARNTTRIAVGNAAGSRNQISGSGAQGETAPGTQTVNFLDSPATTSALTYQIKFASPYAGYAGYINRQNNQSNNVFIQYPSSTITVMEIAQ